VFTAMQWIANQLLILGIDDEIELLKRNLPDEDRDLIRNFEDVCRTLIVST
jgi:hypothetical protein